MHALIVVAHHHPRSLTHALAARIAEGVVRAGHSAETPISAAEGFEPRFGLADHAVHRGQASPPADVLAEQARIDRADTLVLVYPIYWWSMPALLKGWIDRVFSNGWAFDYSIGGDLRKSCSAARGAGRCRRRDAGTFERHGYAGAMRTQIDHGIFDYCGARVVRSELLLESESADPIRHLDQALHIGSQLFAARGAQGAAQAQPLEA